MAAIVLTTGSVIEHRDSEVVDITVPGVVRDVPGVQAAGLARSVLASRSVAARLSESGTIPIPAADLRRMVRTEVAGERFKVLVAGEGAGFATVVARRWIATANGMIDEVVRAPDRQRAAAAVRVAAGDERLLRALVAAEVAWRRLAQKRPSGELLVAGRPDPPRRRVPEAWTLVAWSALAALLSAALLAVPTREGRG